MSEFLQNNFESNLSGITESVDVLKRFAKLAVDNGGDPIRMAYGISKVAAELTALATDVRSQALDPLYDSKNTFVVTPEVASAELAHYGSNSG